MPAGYGSGNSSSLDTIIRIYKNAAADVLAIQSISVVIKKVDGINAAGMALVTDESITSLRFRRTATFHVTTERFINLAVSRVISSIDTSGNFNSYTSSAGDVTSVTYTGAASVENDIVFAIQNNTELFHLGDSV